ncbi:hypothetical protein [Sphingomonas sp. RS2018]
MKIGMVSVIVAALLLNDGGASAQDISTPPPIPVDEKTTGSSYLQCDGNSNNMSAGESIARFVGAVTLLGLFAPGVEQPSPAARLFGEKGVAACTRLIDGPGREGKTVRRLPLILARALHRIEAGDYKGAIGDVTLARQEAAAAGLVGNPYFDRSLGLSFDMIEAHALFGAGDVAAARAVSLRRVPRYRYSYYPLVAADGFRPAVPTVEQLEIDAATQFGRLDHVHIQRGVDALEDAGRFAEAAGLARDYNEQFAITFPKADPSSVFRARVAVDLALAGRWDESVGEVEAARKILQTLDASGKPDAARAFTVELLDFHRVLMDVRSGRWADAWRGYTARSEWSAPSFGQQIGALALLEPHRSAGGAAASAVDAKLLRQRRRDTYVAAKLERYKDNRYLWSHILPYAAASSYDELSRKVWDGKKARFFSDRPYKDSTGFQVLVSGDPMTQVDALVLHAAVVARARGHRGFYMYSGVGWPGLAIVRFADPSPTTPASPTFIDAAAAIEELKSVVPTPEELERRRAAANKR